MNLKSKRGKRSKRGIVTQAEDQGPSSRQGCGVCHRAKTSIKCYFPNVTVFTARRRVHESTMSQQQAPMNGNTGGGTYIPPPRQDMEYICAGACRGRLFTTILNVLRLWREERNQAKGADTLSRVWASYHVQEADKKEYASDWSLMYPQTELLLALVVQFEAR